MSTRNKWNVLADYDLDTARAMLSSGRYLYVLFCCQQCLEKSIKGIIAERTGDHPPRIHNLVRLASRAGLDVPGDMLDHLRMLSNYYIASRYPDDSESVSEIKEDVAQDMLAKTEIALEWLRRQ